MLRLQLKAGSEPPLLIEFIVIRQKELRHHTQQLSLGEHHRAVVQHAVRLYRRAYHRRYTLGACLQHLLKPRFCRLEQGFLKEQIAAGISRQGQLRKCHQTRFAVCRHVQLFRHGGGVFRHIAKAQLRHRRSYAHDSLHIVSSFG